MFVHAQSFEDLTVESEPNTSDRLAETGGTTPVPSDEAEGRNAQEQVLEESKEEQDRSSEPEREKDREQVRSSNKAKEEDVTSETWRSHRKHLFVLSEAGKPIYTRYGTEEALSSIMGVMMLLMSFVEDKKNIIRSIHAGEMQFCLN